MATVKVKFRASSVEMKEGSLYYQVIHNRLARQVHTGYRLFPSEWDAGISGIVMDSGTEGGRRNYLLSVKTALADDLSRLRSIIARLERSDVMYTADKVVELFSSPADCGGFVFYGTHALPISICVPVIRSNSRLYLVIRFSSNTFSSIPTLSGL